MNEIWKTITGYPYYEVSNMGRVRSWKIAGCIPGRRASKPKILNPSIIEGCYPNVMLSNHGGKQKTFRIHNLVLTEFVCPRPEGMEACHKNDDKYDNRLENLYWGTHLENCVDRNKNGKHYKGEDSCKSILKEAEVRNILILFKLGSRPCQIHSWFSHANYETIRGIIKRRAWKHLG